MKLYCSFTSPYARKVRVLVRELGLTDDVEEIPVDPFAPPAEFLEANPLSKLPVLQTTHGDWLPDSALIVDYLLRSSSRHITPLPRGRARWRHLRQVQIADGIIDASVATVLEKRRPDSIVYTAWLDRQQAAIERSLVMLAADPPTGDAAGLPGLYEITLGVALGYLKFRLPYLDWCGEHPVLDTWFRDFAKRASMRETQPPA